MNPGSQERIRTDTAVDSRLVVAGSIRAQGNKRAADSSRPVAVRSKAVARQIQGPAPSPNHLRASLRHANGPHHHDHAMLPEHWRQTEPALKRRP